MNRTRGLPFILIGILTGGVVGFVVYQRYRVQPSPFSPFDSPFEATQAYFEKRYPAIGMAGRDIENAIATYRDEHGSFPASLADLHLTNLPSGVSTSNLAYFEYSRPGGDAYLLSVLMGGQIGMQLASHGDFRRIEAVLPNSPASKANVKAGDYVLQIDGNDVTRISYADFVSAIRGESGTSVTLTLQRGDSGKTETVTVMREPSRFPVSFKPR